MIDSKYDHKKIEEGKYEKWVREGLFESGDKSKKAFSIVIPPPNVTGKLHLGHAWNTTIQDVIIRYKRMDGYDVLWLPGMDHAGIATQAKVDKKLKEESINPRGIGRDAWLEHAWDWKRKYAKNIHSQWATLGLSLDYEKERFTLDDGLSKAVNKVFIDLYNEDLIYRGEKIINWDPEAMTALSNEEVIYKTVPAKFYHIKYFIENSDEFIEIATTRPETIFGDIAVAVNPLDKRYKSLIGKNVKVPLVDRFIPIIADKHADMTMGTGAVKITPAHDANDYEVGLRHNLERIVVINKNGTMNEKASIYKGMDRFEAREAFVKDLEEAGLIVEIEDITHSAPFSERTDAEIEPYLSKQWFVRMQPLAKKVLEMQKNKNTKINFYPSRYEKIMNHWMDIYYDWCISRQLWWGHRIPAYYKGDEVYVGTNPPEGFVQDEDVLDTWFSSALWPFSTMNWPDEKNADFKRYFPTDVLVTGYDIIPFWVNRMALMSKHFTGKRPFESCIIHGLIRDKQGRKFSKSLGNGVDPMDVCEKYGTDAVRFYLVTMVSNGMDAKYDEEKLASTSRFINKLWNASKFVLMNTENFSKKDYTLDELKIEDKWILIKLNKLIKEVRKNLDKYELYNAGNAIYSFVWDNFCDNYIEMAKHSIDDNTTKSVLLKVLVSILKLLHPYMPFTTDEIYNHLPIKDARNIAISEFPKVETIKYKENKIDDILEFVKIFRTYKLQNKIGKEFSIRINTDEDYTLIKNLLKINGKEKKDEEYNILYDVVYKNYSITVFYGDETSQNDKELKEKHISDLKQSIARRKTLLSNENFVKNAKKEVVEKEKAMLMDEESQLKNLEK